MNTITIVLNVIESNVGRSATVMYVCEIMQQIHYSNDIPSNIRVRMLTIGLNICTANHKNLFNTMSTTITIVGKYYHHHDN